MEKIEYNFGIDWILKPLENLKEEAIKNPNRLIIKTINKGNLTNTKIGILSIKGITNKKLINNIIKQINKINIDGLIDSSYVKRNLENKNQLFPTIIQTERPDKAAMQLLEGKVIVVVDNSPYILILPTFFIDFFHTVDDYYQSNYHLKYFYYN